MMNVPVTMSGQMVVCAGCGLAYQVPLVQPVAQPFAQPLVPPHAAPHAHTAPAPAAALPPVEVLAPPKPSTPPKPHGEPHVAESPTAALPPAVTKAWQEAVRSAPKSHDAAHNDARPSPKPGEAAAKDDRVFPSSTTPPAATLPPVHSIAGAARDEFSAVEARLQQARQKTRVTIFVAVFGIVVMMLFAWFVVNLSRPR